MHVREEKQFRVLVRFEDGPETLQCGVDGTAKGRSSYEIDLVMEGEVLGEFAALFIAQVGEEGVANDMVFCAEIVETLVGVLK